MASEDIINTLPEFPVSSLLPREETNVLSFLKDYPDYDGRDVIIAVFDSGVDPAAPGLQTCPNGDIKVIDRIDASGSGDVDTSTVVRASPEGTIIGASGKVLTIPSDWKNPSGDYHVGIKSAYSIYSHKFKDTVIKQRKEEIFEPQHKKFMEAAMRRLQKEKARACAVASTPTDDSDSATFDCMGEKAVEDWGRENSSEDMLSRADNFNDNGDTMTGCEDSNPGNSDQALPCTGFLEKQQKEEAEAEVSVLNNLLKKHQDLGAAYDCVVYHDGTCWRACIDTSEVGDLDKGVNLGEYRHTFEHSALTPQDNFTVSINVYNEGNLLEIVGLCSSHGTHVASIAAAYIPDDPERNGVAPGAKIVSVTIGDNRVHGMETGTALSRAMAWVMDNPFYKVDLINMSYGEHCHTTTAGRLGELASDVVNKYGVIWVASASNHGPALSTIGSPPNFFYDCIIGVGAYISPNMMRAEYSMLDKIPGTAYTWSSRGPSIDGAMGVSVCAPGGAIASMPTFTAKTNQLLNGTSMASPHAAGCVALLLSALKQRQLWYCPFSVRRAIENTAQTLLGVEVFVQGHGLLQVDQAFEYMKKFGVPLSTPALIPPESNMRYVIEIGGKLAQKGVYLREWAADRTVDCTINVTPVQFDDTRSDDAQKRQLNLDLVLLCTASWVSTPDVLHLSYTQRSFTIRINPRGLEPGEIYFTKVVAYVHNAHDRGPLFEVPVTIVIPLRELEHGYFYKGPSEVYRAGHIRRKFIKVPDGATHAQVIIKSSNSDQQQRIALHALQMVPQCSVIQTDFYKNFQNLIPNEQTSVYLPVQANLTLEVCLARWWAAPHDSEIEYSVSFHGVLPLTSTIHMMSSCNIHRIDVLNRLRNEDIAVQAVVSRQMLSLNPYEARIEVLGGMRDTVPYNRPIYQLVLSYTFSISKASEVQPRCNLLSDYLYESAYESQLWMLFDSRKQFLGAGDAYAHKYGYKLEKGDYVIRQHVRHDRPDMLEKLQDMPITISVKLPSDVPVGAYFCYHGALTNTKKINGTVITPKADYTPVFLTVPNLSENRAFKHAGLAPGQVLTGTIAFSRDDSIKKANSFPLHIHITEAVTTKKKVPSFLSDQDKKELRSASDYDDAERELAIQWIPKLELKTSSSLYADMIDKWPESMKLRMARLYSLDAHFSGRTTAAPSSGIASGTVQKDGNSKNEKEGKEDEPVVEFWEHWRSLVESIANDLQKIVDVPAILAFLGTKTDTRTDATKYKSQMDHHRAAITDAYCKHGLAILYPHLPTLIIPTSKPTPASPSKGCIGPDGKAPPPVFDITVPPTPPEEVLNQLDTIASFLLKLVEPNESKVISFFIGYYQVRRFYASATKLLMKQMDDRPCKENYLRLASGVRLLGYHHVVHDMCRGFHNKFPDKFTPF